MSDTALMREPRYDPLCGRCGGPSGPEGAWCDNCIRECKEYPHSLDSQCDMREVA
jgi:hypothetical protein